MVIEAGLTEMKSVREGNYICDETLSKMQRNKLKNWEFLYNVIREDPVLMDAFFIPMACSVTYKGYSCFVTSKIIPS